MQNRLQDVAAVLGIADDRGDARGRFVGLEFEASLKAQTLCLHGLGQDRTFAFELRLHEYTGLADLGFHHFPVPGNLGKQSEGQREAEIGKRWRGAVVAAGALRLVAVNRKTPCVPLLAHPFQRLGVRL